MERTESYYFFKLLNLCKRRLSYEHYNRYLSVCKEEDMVPKGIRLKKQANIEVVSRCFENDWGSILLDESKKLQDLLVRETGNVERELTEEISEIKRFIKDRYGEVTLDEMVRGISVICNKLNDALLERRRNKLTVLQEGKERPETRENSCVTDGVVEEDVANGGNRAEGEPPVEQIETFMSDIRQQVSRRDFGRDENFEVVVEDLCSEENLADVNPLPVDCPLLLVDLREVTSNLDGVIQEARDGGNIRHGVVNTEIRTPGETSVASFTVIREDNIRPPVTGNGLDTVAGLETGNRIVVNLSEASHRSRSITFIEGTKF